LTKRRKAGAISIGRLAIVAAVLIACAHTPSSDSSAIELNGRRFTVVLDDQSPLTVDSMEEMERVGGFPFVFPSYLPDGMDDKMSLSAWGGGEATVKGIHVKGDPYESVLIYHKHLDTPSITITEEMRASPESDSARWIGRESHVIGGIDVRCDLMNPGDEVILVCDWESDKREFEAMFRRTGGSPTPYSIPEDMRQEALKVIQSMIEAPAQWEPVATPQVARRPR